jgi:agmatinase
MDALERTYMDEERTFFAHELATDEFWMDRAIDQMTDNVFITFDLDGLDPSIMPSTGTPEPGGLFWYETLEFLRKVFEEKNVVGFDLVELCPNPNDRSSDFLAAKLYYKMLSYKFESADTESEFEEDMDLEDRKGNSNRILEEDDY